MAIMVSTDIPQLPRSISAYNRSVLFQLFRRFFMVIPSCLRFSRIDCRLPSCHLSFLFHSFPPSSSLICYTIKPSHDRETAHPRFPCLITRLIKASMGHVGLKTVIAVFRKISPYAKRRVRSRCILYICSTSDHFLTAQK